MNKKALVYTSDTIMCLSYNVLKLHALIILSQQMSEITQPGFTSIEDWTQKLMTTDSNEMHTTPNTITLVLANIPAPTKHTNKLMTLMRVQ
jgi:hypothetical protein